MIVTISEDLVDQAQLRAALEMGNRNFQAASVDVWIERLSNTLRKDTQHWLFLAEPGDTDSWLACGTILGLSDMMQEDNSLWWGVEQDKHDCPSCSNTGK